MKPAQSSFDERLTRINAGTTQNVADVVVASKGLINTTGKKKFIYFDMLVAGLVGGGIAGTLFAQNLGLLFIMSLDWITFYGLILSDHTLAAYILACALAPIGFIFTLIFNRTARRGFQFWMFNSAGVLAANHVELRYLIEFVIVPGFWDYVGAYTSAAGVVNDAAATQPQL
ncbi:hypothetical protein [Tateyamaria sp.]|uniref:hypothetical protein n=1 Tax=Tateyamaria sp. TaxID=1929288 RepID=UPI0032A07D0C